MSPAVRLPEQGLVVELAVVVSHCRLRCGTRTTRPLASQTLLLWLAGRLREPFGFREALTVGPKLVHVATCWKLLVSSNKEDQRH